MRPMSGKMAAKSGREKVDGEKKQAQLEVLKAQNEVALMGKMGIFQP